jgi:hypothetical protein
MKHSRQLKTLILALLASLMFSAVLTGCGQSKVAKEKTEQSQRKNSIIQITKERWQQSTPGTEKYYSLEADYYRELYNKDRNSNNKADMQKYGIKMAEAQKKASEILKKNYK